MAKLSTISNWEPGLADYQFYCPGCECYHGIWVKSYNGQNAIWEFNGDINKPTFKPSLKVTWVKLPDNPEKDNNGNYILGEDGRIKGVKDMICHTFITDGNIQYLGDCTHELSGETIEMEDIK